MVLEAVTSTDANDAAEALRICLAQRDNLPINPTVLIKLMELGRNPDATPNDYADVITANNSLTAKVIATVNSSWYGLRYRVSNIMYALNLLGTVNIRILAITHCLAAVNEGIQLPAGALDHYGESSLIKASAAAHLATYIKPTAADQAFLAAMMSDIALPLMHQFHGEMYETHICMIPARPSELSVMERELFGMDHAEAAAVLGRTVGIPEQFCDMLRCHHDRAALRDLCQDPDLADAVYFAGLFPHMMTCWGQEDAAEAAELVDERLGDEHGPFEQVLSEIQGRFTELAELVRPNATRTPDLAELLGQATSEMSKSSAQTSAGPLTGSPAAPMTAPAAPAMPQGSPAPPDPDPAQLDPASGVLTRVGFAQASSAKLAEFEQIGCGLALLLIDLEAFKMLTGRLSREQIDQALRHMGTLMREVFGPEALVGRHGGEEFVALIGGLVEPRQANKLAHKLTGALMRNPPAAGPYTLPVTLRVAGVWQAQAGPTATLDDLLQRANVVMYQSKMTNGDLIVFELSEGQAERARG